MTSVKPVRADKPRIYIVDVMNRDGVQSHGVYISPLERTMINHDLSRMGIFQSEFGFPCVPHEENYLKANLELERLGYFSPMVLEGWIRAISEDVEKAREYGGLEHLNLSASTSEVMINGKYQGRKTGKDVISEMSRAVKRAKELGFKTVGVNAEDASRTRHYQDQSFLEEFFSAAKEAGADRMRYCDTLGYDRTASIYERVYRLAEAVLLPVEIHCHNDTGYAVPNSVEGAMGALEAGVDAYVNTTPNGLGERAGNADLVSVLLAVKHSNGLEGKDILDPKINLKMAWHICNYVSKATGIPIPPNQPGVGSNVFSHESGIHADGMIKNGLYELFPPEELGIPRSEEIETGRRICVGDFSGKAGLAYVLDMHGIKATDADRTLDLVQRATQSVKRGLDEDELRFIAEYPDQASRMLVGAA